MGRDPLHVVSVACLALAALLVVARAWHGPNGHRTELLAHYRPHHFAGEHR